MAITKATTTADLTDTGKAAGPTEQERVDQVVALTDEAVLADVKSPKYVRVTSPAGFVSDVPESIVQSLLDSGYSKAK